MNISIKHLSVILFLIMGAGFAANVRAESYTITADMWIQPRSGEVMLEMPPVHAAIQDWMKYPGSKLIILHSGDDMGSLWASEVQDWLVSLGIPSSDIARQVSGQDENSVTLEVTP